MLTDGSIGPGTRRVVSIDGPYPVSPMASHAFPCQQEPDRFVEPMPERQQ